MPAVKRIYVEAFPASERRPVAWLYEAAGRADFSVIVAEQNGIVLGFATLFRPRDAGDAALLDYFAIDAGSRGTGVGGRLFQSVVDQVGQRPMLIEVEKVGDPPDTCRQRRQAFYRRHGCGRILDLSYQLPIPTVGKPPMELMITNPPETLDRATLLRWLTTIYTKVYGCKRDDPRLEIMLPRSSRPTIDTQ